MSRLDRYTCEDVFRRLDDFLDRELKPGESIRVRAHLETCSACAGEYAFEKRLLLELRTKLRRVSIPSRLRQRFALRLAGTMFRVHSFSRRLPPKAG